MKKYLGLLLGASLLLTSVDTAIAKSKNKSEWGVYRQEFEALKDMEEYKLIFNKKTHFALQDIQRDLELCKELDWSSRSTQSLFLACGVIVVTPKNMPKLYAYIETICKKSNMQTPVVFITTRKGLFNAFAQKMFANTGGILIGQDLLLEISDDALEGVVAHELGHIYHEHGNKSLAIKIASAMGVAIAIEFIIGRPDPNLARLNPDYIIKDRVLKVLLSLILSPCVSSCIIGKKFEYQADEFACKQANRSKELIKFFIYLQRKEYFEKKEFEQNLDTIYKAIQASKSQLSWFDYMGLMSSYYGIKVDYKIMQAYYWFYLNTVFGAHPKTEDRIKKAKEYS